MKSIGAVVYPGCFTVELSTRERNGEYRSLEGNIDLCWRCLDSSPIPLSNKDCFIGNQYESIDLVTDLYRDTEEGRFVGFHTVGHASVSIERKFPSPAVTYFVSLLSVI